MRDDLEPTGDCYAAAGEYLREQSVLGRTDIVLVHGRPTLQRPPFVQYGHAWIELEQDLSAMFAPHEFGAPGRIPQPPAGRGIAAKLELCMDVEREAILPKQLFYMLGKIDPAECFRYTFHDLRSWVTMTGHWGPWEGPEAVGPIEEQL